jgi:hypothetical protein
MPSPAIAQVEDALGAALAAWPALAGHTIITDGNPDIALDDAAMPAIQIFTTAYTVELFDEYNQSLHRATIEFEAVSDTPTAGTISRANHETIAHVLACIAADRQLGGLLQDIQEVDVAPSSANGRDVGSASLQVTALFFTARDDWFTILG